MKRSKLLNQPVWGMKAKLVTARKRERPVSGHSLRSTNNTHSSRSTRLHGEVNRTANKGHRSWS